RHQQYQDAQQPWHDDVITPVQAEEMHGADNRQWTNGKPETPTERKHRNPQPPVCSTHGPSRRHGLWVKRPRAYASQQQQESNEEDMRDDPKGPHTHNTQQRPHDDEETSTNTV